MVPRYSPAVRSLLRDALPSAAALRSVGPSGEHAARKFVTGHPGQVAEPPQGALRYVASHAAQARRIELETLRT